MTTRGELEQLNSTILAGLSGQVAKHFSADPETNGEVLELTHEWEMLLAGGPRRSLSEKKNADAVMEAHQKKMVEFLADHPDQWRLSA